MKQKNNKCNCPLCNKAINKRELKEENKLNNICNLFRRLMEESSRIKGNMLEPSPSNEAKKRKFEEFERGNVGLQRRLF